MVNLLIETYANGNFSEPEEVKRCKEDWIGKDECDFIKKFCNDYTISNNLNDYVKSSDIECWIIYQQLGITMVKFAKELKQCCIIHKLNNVIYKVKKLDGKSLMVWFGIKKIIEVEECEVDTEEQEVIPKIIIENKSEQKTTPIPESISESISESEFEQLDDDEGIEAEELIFEKNKYWKDQNSDKVYEYVLYINDDQTEEEQVGDCIGIWKDNKIDFYNINIVNKILPNK